MHWYDHGMSGWGYGVMLVNGLVFWALVVAVGVLLYRVLRRGEGGGGRGGPDEPARQTLAERYARGEIDDEEYRRRLETLRRG
jgi:putative membrane protein